MTHTTKTPQLFIEQLAAKELSATSAAEITKRLEMEDGLDRIDAVYQSNKDILNAYPPAQLAASIRMRHTQSREKRHFRTLWILAPVVAAAASALLLLIPIHEQNHGTESFSNSGTNTFSGAENSEYIGIKGDAQLYIHKKTSAGETLIQQGDLVKEGDSLQIKFNTGNANSMVICSVDGRGSVTLHFPTQENSSTVVKPFSKQTLPFGYELDDAPRFERFFMVWSKNNHKINPQSVVEAIKSMKNAQTDKPALPSQVEYKDVVVKK